MIRFFKILILLIVILFIAIQFYPRPVKNKGGKNNPNDISLIATTPVDVQNILKSSCYDCHSNNTTYPWYSNMQPFAWWLGDHIKEGKKELNFSEFNSYSIRRKYKKYNEIKKEVEEDEMPLKSYELLHPSSDLSADEKSLIISWTDKELQLMEQRYPADSLISRK